MAYINHPTRYLIVKDPAAVAAGRFWAALVSLGKLRPAAHLVKLFFQLSFGAPVRFDRAADSATEGRFYARPSGPSTLFFNSVSLSRSGRVAVSHSRSRAIYPTARGPSTLFFNLAPKRRCVSVRVGFPKSGGAFLRPSPRPVNTFFKSVSLARSGRARLSVRELGYLPNRPRNVNTFFQLVTRPPRKRHFRAARKWRYTPGPMGCQRGRLHYFHTATFYHGFPLIQGGCAALAAAPVLPPPHVTLAWTLHDCRARRQGLPRLPRPG